MAGTYTNQVTKYRFTDSQGNIHTRTSKAGRVYTHAFVTFGGKVNVQFCGSLRLAQSAASAYHRWNPRVASEIIEIKPV